MTSTRELARDAGLLILRASIGGVMVFAHGMPKLLGYAEKSAQFPDPLGVGSSISLVLTIFAEVFCATAILLGLATRFTAGVLAFTMLIAFFVVHGGDPFSDRELALAYALASSVLILTGPGRFSLDRVLFGGRSRGALKLDV